MIKLFEDFSNITLKSNYEQYYQHYKKGENNHDKVAWYSSKSQNKNFFIVNKNIKNNSTLLDFGCGIGDFISYLKFKNKKINKYLGVDINSFFIKKAKKLYPDFNFKLIKGLDDINDKWDYICAIGTFTWFITKTDFINIINKLYNICNEEVLITGLYGETPYNPIFFNTLTEKEKKYVIDIYWNENYRYYDEYLFYNLFPNFKFEFLYIDNTMLIKIKK